MSMFGLSFIHATQNGNKYICVCLIFRYIPPVKENLLQALFHPNEARKSVFAGKLFLFLEEKQASDAKPLKGNDAFHHPVL